MSGLTASANTSCWPQSSEFLSARTGSQNHSRQFSLHLRAPLVSTAVLPSDQRQVQVTHQLVHGARPAASYISHQMFGITPGSHESRHLHPTEATLTGQHGLEVPVPVCDEQSSTTGRHLGGVPCPERMSFKRHPLTRDRRGARSDPPSIFRE